MIHTVRCIGCRSMVTVSCPLESPPKNVRCFSCSKRHEADRRSQAADRRRQTTDRRRQTTDRRRLEANRRSLEAARRRRAHYRSLMDRLEGIEACIVRLKGARAATPSADKPGRLGRTAKRDG